MTDKQSCYQDWIDDAQHLTQEAVDNIELDEKHQLRLLIDSMPMVLDIHTYRIVNGKLEINQEIHTARSSSISYGFKEVKKEEHTVEYLLKGWLVQDQKHQEELGRPLVHYQLREI